MRIDTTKRLSHRDLEAPVKEFTEPFDYCFNIDQTIEEALRELQDKAEKHLDFFFVTDSQGVLKGFITPEDLLYNPPKTKLHQIADLDVVKVHESDPLEKGLRVLSKHQVLMLPVVDRYDRLKGVLEIQPMDERVLRPPKVHYKNLKEDLFQFIGFSIEQRKWKSPWAEYRMRMPWLICNLIGGLVCAVISELLKLTLIKFVILAFFIPLVLTLSESVAIQSMTLSLRFLHIRKIQVSQVLRRLSMESRSSFLLASTCAAAIAFFYFAWSVALLPVLSIVISVVITMMCAAFFGALFPVLLHALKLDPKVAAGPVVLMLTDIFTIGIYLGLATQMLM